MLATLGLTLAYAGRTAPGLAAFDRAPAAVQRRPAGRRVLHRRGLALWTLGRYAGSSR